MMRIRRARLEDLASILRIEAQSFGSAAWDRDLFHEYFSRPDMSVFLVAIIDDVVVAYALSWHSKSRAEIHSVAVCPAHRGKGVAVALLKRVLRALRRRGLVTVGLNVRTDNTAAIGLYLRIGFQRLRRITGYYEDGSPAWRMQWSG